MKKLVFGILFLNFVSCGISQTPQELAVALTANVSDTQIILNWPVTSAETIKVYRKENTNESSFLAPIANVSGSSVQYIDNTIVPGEIYEYRVEIEKENYSSNGYVVTGSNVSINENKGTLILLVANEIATPLEQELITLKNDIEGDGWLVERVNVNSTETPKEVKNKIIALFNAAPTEVKAVFIIGHVAVPYSGLLDPDGHIEHRGAWPADGYYGDMDGNWTDSTVNDTQAEDLRNHNIPGDGKFDQSELPSNLELQVGRVDFYNLPLFNKSETELLKAYLNKNHAYRHRNFIAEERALIDDNFGGDQNSFSSSVYRSFYTMFSSENIHDKDYFSTLIDESYLWSYGNGPGYYNSVRDVGETADFVTKDVKTVFTNLFGSYLGDWDSKNNIMRASLASGNVLTCTWSGRPQWQFHQMAFGENIGVCAKNTSNGFDYEYTDYNNKAVHVALLGDPTLRMHTIAPPTNINISSNDKVEISWNASNDNVLGYHVYKKNNTGKYQRITTELISGTTFASEDISQGLHSYMVRAMKLQETPSGSYYNLSQGVFAEIQVDAIGEPSQPEDPIEEPDIIDEGKIILHPNPTMEMVYIESEESIEDILITDISGKTFFKSASTAIDLSTLANGFYILQFLVNNKIEKRIIIKNN